MSAERKLFRQKLAEYGTPSKFGCVLKCNKLCGRPPRYAPAPCKLTFDLESGVRVMCDVGYHCADFSLPRPLCSRLRPDVRDRQTSDAHHHLMPPPYVGGGIIVCCAGCRPWDMSRFMYRQCTTSNIAYPRWAEKWVNLRKVFSSAYRLSQPSLSTMLGFFGLRFEGRQHSGIDDARNIARVLARLIVDGYDIYENEMISLGLLLAATDDSRVGAAQVAAADANALDDNNGDDDDDEDISEETAAAADAV